jgi:probable rRNA maturation factor
LQAESEDWYSQVFEVVTMSQITIDITVRSPTSFVVPKLLEVAIRRILMDEGICSGTVSIAIVDDAEIHRINREFLGHDYPTDVISFLLNDPSSGLEKTSGSNPFPFEEFENDGLPGNDRNWKDHLDGELIVSSETAAREALAHGWSPEAELLLYVVHGLLHLCGYDDLTDEARPVMRSREREYLALWGFCPTGLEI